MADKPPRLLSLDVFRGLVIVAMLIVNNPGDSSQIGYWWKHVDWISGSQADAYRAWWANPSFATFPLFMHCTLADFVMPWFMLIIGVAMPFAVAAGRSRGNTPVTTWLRILRRSGMLILLGWAIDNSLVILYWKQSGGALNFKLGMNVLQLLGVAYLVARLAYELPLVPRLLVAAGLFLLHWAMLRFWPQGATPAGTFTEHHNAAGYIYSTWPIFHSIKLAPHLSFSLVGMLSVPPAAATMLVGSWIGDYLLHADVPATLKVRRMALAGLVGALAGFLWAFDLPFNKPRWTPCYLIYTSGIGAILIALGYWVIDLRQSRWWTRPLVVFGVNSIAAYWVSIMAKVWLLNMTGWGSALIRTLQNSFGPHAGSWAFTLLFAGFWWAVLELAYRRRVFWKL